jgi:pimeloyl-ACP methyl ester carboxylesterase
MYEQLRLLFSSRDCLNVLLPTEIVSVTFDGHFGALHRPRAGDVADMAIVICPAVGRDARCAYRALFCWAQELASLGFPVLRYDPLGEGDSCPLGDDADQLRPWIDGVVQAAKVAREHTGARKLVLVGLRLGGALALAAAQKVKPDGLMLLAPIVSGDAFLRELKLAAAVQKLPMDEERGLEVDGLRLSPATVANLKSFETAAVAPTWRAAFLATPGPAGALAGRLGDGVASVRFEGYSLFFKEPHLNQPPTALFAAASRWLSDFSDGGTVKAPLVRPPPARLDGPGWIERPVTFGDGLRGVLCLPRGKRSGRAVLIGNTAADPRAGNGNFGARASRALASRGVAALRFDFFGLGESPGLLTEGEINCRSRAGDFRAASDVVKECGFNRITLVGVCTGGYHAVEAALEAGRYERAVAFNTWLVYRPSRPLFLRSETAKGGEPRRAVVAGASRWRRIVHGEIDLGVVLARTARQLWSFLWPDPECRAVRRRIGSACAAGAEIHLLQGRGDASTRRLADDFGPGYLWLRARPGVALSVLERLEHAVSSTQGQAYALRELFRIIGAGPRPIYGAADAAARATVRGRGAPTIARGGLVVSSPAHPAWGMRSGGARDLSQV